MAKSTQHLYGIDSFELHNLSYPDALKYKISSANILIGTLLEPHYSDRDYHRIRDVTKAIKFNEDLLKELKC